MDPCQKSEIHTVLGLFLLMGIVQKPTARSYFSKRRVISTPEFAAVIIRERIELICKFLHFKDNESLPTYQGPSILFKIYPVISSGFHATHYCKMRSRPPPPEHTIQIV